MNILDNLSISLISDRIFSKNITGNKFKIKINNLYTKILSGARCRNICKYETHGDPYWENNEINVSGDKLYTLVQSSQYIPLFNNDNP